MPSCNVYLVQKPNEFFKNKVEMIFRPLWERSAQRSVEHSFLELDEAGQARVPWPTERLSHGPCVLNGWQAPSPVLGAHLHHHPETALQDRGHRVTSQIRKQEPHAGSWTC